MNSLEVGAMVTCSEEMKRVITVARNVASSKATILIIGASGTGKELLAKYIHDQSPRAQRRFIAINCAALPEGLLESELFGFEKGAFTGALSQKLGKFELAHQSTILLDEISELPLTLQAKLLRVLQEEEIDRLGGRSPVKVNIRVIATSNKDLRSLVNQGLFREDLYYRLNVIKLKIPSLVERPEDIRLLALHFAKISSLLNSKPTVTFDGAALNKIAGWKWPGNVRELENVIERAVLLASDGLITSEHIQIDDAVESPSQIAAPAVVGTTIGEMEKQLILGTLKHTLNNRTQAAHLLGISVRTLRNKLKEYRMEESA